MKQKSAIFLLVCCLLFCNCEKKDTYTHLNPALASAFIFHQGSYWIYKDSITGAIDSMYVKYYDSIPVPSNSDPTHYNDIITMVFGNYNGNLNYRDDWNIVLKNNEFVFSGFSSNTDGVENTLMIGSIQFPFVATTWGGYSNESCYVRVLPEYMVSGSEYFKVAQLNCRSSYANIIAKYDDHIYMDSSIGIIKYIFNHESDTVLKIIELQRYHIVL